MLIIDSHEFLELYRGDKDVRMAMEWVKADPEVQVMSLGPDSLSPVDAVRFGAHKLTEIALPELPDRMTVRLLPSHALRFARRESGGIVAFAPGQYKAIVDAKPDVIFENPYSWLTPRTYATWAASLQTGAPIVYYDPGDDIPIGAKHRTMAIWETPVIRHASAIITYNEAGRNRFMRKYGYPAERIHVIPKPVEVARWYGSGRASELRASFGAAEDQIVVGYVGRLAHYKGSSVLLDVARSAENDPTLAACRFVFVGGALGTEETDDDYKGANRCVVGMIPNEQMPDYLAALDVVVFPDVTRPGGFPTAVAEAMASGRPLIVGIGDRTEFMPLKDGENALLIEPRSPEAIARALRRLAADAALRGRLGMAVHSYAAAEMDYSVQAPRYLSIARNAVAETRGVRL